MLQDLPLVNRLTAAPIVKNSEINGQTQKKPTTTYLNIPVENWLQITENFDIQTSLSLRKTNKYFANLFTIQSIKDKFYKQHISPYSMAYSVASYNDFIAPILEKLAPDIKITIDEYLEKSENNPLLDKTIPAFIFNKILIATHNLEQTQATIIPFSLPENNEYIEFAMSALSSNCAFLKKNGEIELYYISTTGITFFKKILSFYPYGKEDNIFSMQFTPKNNLLTIGYEDLTLWNLMLNNDENKYIEQIWCIKLDFSHPIDKVLLLKNETDFILSYKNDKTTYFYSKHDDLFSIEPLEEYFYLTDDNQKYKFITDIAIDTNNNSLAIALSNYDYYNRRAADDELCMFSIKNSAKSFNKENFIREKLPIIRLRYDNTRNYHSGMQFNTTGDIFVYISDVRSGVVVLNKIDGKWFNAICLYDTNYADIKIMPSAKHIAFVKCYRNEHDELKHGLEVMAIPENNYIKDDNDEDSSHLWDKDFRSFHPYIHPTGLAIVAFSRNKQKVRVILPKQAMTLKNTISQLTYCAKNSSIKPNKKYL